MTSSFRMVGSTSTSETTSTPFIWWLIPRFKRPARCRPQASLRNREHDTGRKICPAGPGAEGWGYLQMEAHPADLDLPSQRIVDRNIYAGAVAGGEGAKASLR